MADPLILTWPGGEHGFLLRLGELRALDDRLRDGAYSAFYRLQSVKPRADDVIEVLRLGLIGGGLDRAEAARLVTQVEGEVGIGELAPLAAQIVLAAFHRREGEQTEDGDAPGEAQGAG